MQKTFNDPIMPIHSPRIIQFEHGYESRGFRKLMLSGAPVRVVGKNKYVVNDIHCSMLKKSKIPYRKL